MQQENKNSYTERQKSYIYKYREINKDKINAKLRERYANNKEFRENIMKRNKEYYNKNKLNILSNEKRKIRMRLYAKIKYYERKVQELGDDSCDNSILIKYTEILRTLKDEYKTLVKSSIDCTPISQVKQSSDNNLLLYKNNEIINNNNNKNNINDNINNVIHKNSSNDNTIITESYEEVNSEIHNVITVTNLFLKKLNFDKRFDNFCIMLSYIIYQSNMFNHFSPKSISAGICMFTLLYLEYEIQTNVSLIVDKLGISVTTIKKICKEIKVNEHKLIPSSIQHNKKSLNHSYIFEDENIIDVKSEDETI